MANIIPRAFYTATLDLGRVVTPCLGSVRHNYTHIEHAKSTHFRLSHRTLPHPKEKVPLQPRVKLPSNFRHVYPDFLPDFNPLSRNKLKEMLDRHDMITRRKHIDIPEFYVGSVMAVTINDPNATGRSSRFVGICIQRMNRGLKSNFTLRNVLDYQGMEIMYEMYCPVISSIETLRLEKRLDPHLLYLRDARPEYSTFPMDMEPELIAEDAPVPINDVKVKMIDGDWDKSWERQELKGIDLSGLTELQKRMALKRKTPDYVQYDLMKEYRSTLPEEDQEDIYREIAPHYPALVASQRKFRRRKLAGDA
uniref:Large ribosomal subunit protein bL19m n=2 Tax=Hirondellea gigas TaxID=1518452 RepID=A0A2P2I584_9CRUS